MVKGLLLEFKHLWQNQNVTGKQLRGFLYVILGVCLLIALFRFYKHDGNISSFDFQLYILALIFFFLFFIRPVFIFLYKLWMSIALVLGFFVSNLVLAIVFYLVITPFGFVMRILKKDPIKKEFRTSEKTYWEIPLKKNYQKQF